MKSTALTKPRCRGSKPNNTARYNETKRTQPKPRLTQIESRSSTAFSAPRTPRPPRAETSPTCLRFKTDAPKTALPPVPPRTIRAMQTRCRVFPSRTLHSLGNPPNPPPRSRLSPVFQPKTAVVVVLSVPPFRQSVDSERAFLRERGLKRNGRTHESRPGSLYPARGRTTLDVRSWVPADRLERAPLICWGANCWTA